MKEKHIILRSGSVSTRDPFAGTLAMPRGAEGIATGLTVEIDAIDRHAIFALTNRADVLAVAPVVPMLLITPTEVQDSVPPSADGV